MITASTQKAICSLERGLYVIRYVSSVEQGVSPRAEVTAAGGYEDQVMFIPAPGVLPGRLDAPGAAMVVVSRAPIKLEIRMISVGQNRPPQAQFNLELLSAGEDLDSSPVLHDVDVASSETQHVKLVAHVSRIGDVTVEEGAWIGGPNAPSPIEALGIYSLVDSLGLTAEFVNSLRPNQWIACASSEFIGTRQQASPLLGVKLRLHGPRAAQFTLKVEALFLGSPAMTASGQQVTVASESGQDPMIGFRLWISEAVKQTTQDKPGNLPRVRVFRAN